MPSLKNPMNSTNSWQFNYVLLAASSTNDIANVVSLNSSGTISEKFIQKIQTFKIGKPYLDNATGATFIPVLNTMINQEYSVDSCDIDTIAVQRNSPGVATSINMMVSEPKGIFFPELLKWASNKLMMNFKGVYYLLIIVAKGFDIKGNCVSHYMYPRLMMISGLSMDISTSGAKYKLSFYDIGCGTTNCVDNIRAPMEFNTQSSSTVGQALRNLEIVLNSQASITYNSVLASGKQAKASLYQITWPDQFETCTLDKSIFDELQNNFNVSSGNNYNMSAEQQQAAAKDGNNTSFSYERGQTVKSMMSDILMSSQAITQQFNIINSSTDSSADSVAGNGTNKKLFNIYTAITSDETTVTYHFDVIIYNADTKPIEPDIEYNYIHTGLNTEVLDLKLHLDGIEGYTFIQLPYGDNLVVGTDDPLPNDSTPSPIITDDKFKTSVMDEARKSRLEYINSFALFFGRSKSSTTMTIRGNLALLGKMSIGALPHSSPASIADTENYKKAVQLVDTPLISRPLLVKINVNVPKSNSNEWGSSYVVRDSNGAVNAWWSGRYLVQKIQSHFSGGKFTQDLVLIWCAEDGFNTYGNGARQSGYSSSSYTGGSSSTGMMSSTVVNQSNVKSENSIDSFAKQSASAKGSFSNNDVQNALNPGIVKAVGG